MKVNKNFIISFTSIFLFIIILLDILRKGFLFNLDLKINSFIFSFISNFFIKVFSIITFFGGGYFILFAVLILVIYFVYKKEFKKANFLILVISLTGILIFLIKELVQRARPQNHLVEVFSYSFPSGHSTISTVFFLLIVFFFKDYFKKDFNKYLFIFTNILFIFLIGISRIILLVHWPTDILAGWILGVLIFIIFISFFKKFK